MYTPHVAQGQLKPFTRRTRSIKSRFVAHEQLKRAERLLRRSDSAWMLRRSAASGVLLSIDAHMHAASVARERVEAGLWASEGGRATRMHARHAVRSNG